MKNFPLYILLFFIYTNSIETHGQVLLKKFITPINNQSCYPKDNYPLLDNVLDEILKKDLGYEFCTVNCPFQPLPSCIAILTNEDEVVTDEPDDWCLQGNLIFQWSCGSIAVPGDPENTDAVVVDEPFSPPTQGAGDGELKPVPFGQSIFGIYPNPSDGKFILTLEDVQSINPLKLRFTDWSGKTISIMDLSEDVLEKNQLTIDLNDQPAGVYFANIYTSEAIIQTQKILIQR